MDLFPRDQYSDIPTNLKSCSETNKCVSKKVFGMYVGIFGGIFVLLGIGVRYWWNWDDDDGGFSGITLKIGRWFGKIGEQRRKKKEEGEMARKAKEEREKVGVEERAKEEGLAADMNGEEEANERQESIGSDETLDEPAMLFTRIQKLIIRPFRLAHFPHRPKPAQDFEKDIASSSATSSTAADIEKDGVPDDGAVTTPEPRQCITPGS